MSTKIIGIFIGSLLVTPLLVACGASPIDSDDLKPVAHQLKNFSSCEELLTWQINRNRDNVGPDGWQLAGDQYYAMREDSLAPNAAGKAEGQASSATGTNTQESDVDEPDFAKINGQIVVSATNNSVVITDVTGATPKQIGSYSFTRDSYLSDLLLVGNHVIVATDHPMALEDQIGPGDSAPVSAGYMMQGTTLHNLDLTDPTNPKLTWTRSYSGNRVSLRQYDDVVRVVLTDGLPNLEFTYPTSTGWASRRKAAAYNRKILQESKINDWLPSVTVNGVTTPAVRCEDVARPDSATGGDTVTILTFKPDDADAEQSTAVTAAGGNVYSSTKGLYVTSTQWDQRGWLRRQLTDPKVTTEIHKFSLSGLDTQYVASGSLVGTVRDQWSMDEHKGDLRVARSLPDSSGQTNANGVAVLRQDGKTLKQIGSIDDLGINEEIQSVRWLDDLAIVVTFRQVDPLYTIDLSDPAAPKKLGELKIPGFSAYLHPIGQDQLIGIGVDADTQGRMLGAQLATFDLSDPAAVRQIQLARFGADSTLMATYDPKAFTWLPESRRAITTLSGAAAAKANRLLIVEVADDGTFTQTLRPLSAKDYEVRALPLGTDRIAVVSRDSVKLIDLGSPAK